MRSFRSTSAHIACARERHAHPFACASASCAHLRRDERRSSADAWLIIIVLLERIMYYYITLHYIILHIIILIISIIVINCSPRGSLAGDAGRGAWFAWRARRSFEPRSHRYICIRVYMYVYTYIYIYIHMCVYIYMLYISMLRYCVVLYTMLYTMVVCYVIIICYML